MKIATVRELLLLLAGVAITANTLRTKPPDPTLLATGIGLMAGTGVLGRRSASGGPGSQGPS